MNRIKQAFAILLVLCASHAFATLPNSPVSYVTTGESLATIASVLERTLGAKVVLRGDVGERIIEGRYTGANATAFLDSLATRNGLSWDYQNKQIVIGTDSDTLRAPKGRSGSPTSFSKILHDPKNPNKLGLMIFQVQNAQVEDRRLPGANGAPKVVPGVASLFRQFIGAPALAQASGARPAAPGPAPVGGVTPPAPVSASFLGLFSKSAAGASPAAEEGAQIIGDTTARGVFADVRLNAVLVRDKVELFESYKEIIKLLDRPADMVQLEAFIIDIQKDQVQNIGINLGLGNASATELILKPFSSRTFAAKIKALEVNGLAETLSVPSVISLNNEQALFSSRQNFFISVQGSQNATVNQVTAETQLLVTPQIANESPDVPFDERRVKLLINIQDANANANTTKSSTNVLIASTETTTLPSTTENQITTQAVVRSGDSLVIGGQIVRKKAISRAGLPGFQGFRGILKDSIFSPLLSEKTDEMHDYVRVYVVRPKILGEDSVSANAITADTASRAIANEYVK